MTNRRGSGEWRGEDGERLHGGVTPRVPRTILPRWDSDTLRGRSGRTGRWTTRAGGLLYGFG